jgi:sec-independent protein translocase protein TatB
MFDIGWVEMMVVAIVMIIIIGPKDLPVVLHTMGRWIARVRAMARGFQESIEEMAEEAGLDEVRKQAQSIRDFKLEDEIEKSIDPEGELREGIDAPMKKSESPKLEDQTVTEPENVAEADEPKEASEPAAASQDQKT